MAHFLQTKFMGNISMKAFLISLKFYLFIFMGSV